MRRLKSALSTLFFVALLFTVVYLSGTLAEMLAEESCIASQNLAAQSVKQCSSPGVHFIGERMDVRDLPDAVLDYLPKRSRQIYLTDNYKTVYEDDEGRWREIYYDEYPVSQLRFAPRSLNEYTIGFFYDPEGSQGDTVLVIVGEETGNAKEVYRGNFRTSSWEWDGPERVIVYYNCGTACLYAYKIDIATGERVDEYHVITDYTPPPKAAG